MTRFLNCSVLSMLFSCFLKLKSGGRIGVQCQLRAILQTDEKE